MKEKARYFTFLIYPDSAPEDWKDRLESLDIPMAISPLHDKDEKEGEEKGFKKSHYHVVYVSPNPVTADAVRKRVNRAFETSKAVNLVQIVKTGIESMYLYLTHESKDAIKKKKTKYDKNDIMHLNNFDIDRYVTLDSAQKKEMFNAITGAIRKHGLANIFDLSDYIEEHGEEIGIESVDVMNDIIASKTGLIRMYFDGAYQRRQNKTHNQSD